VDKRASFFVSCVSDAEDKLLKFQNQITTDLLARGIDVQQVPINVIRLSSGNTKGGSITVPWTSCLAGWDLSVFANKNKKISVVI
jgi:hypothetical protein